MIRPRSSVNGMEITYDDAGFESCPEDDELEDEEEVEGLIDAREDFKFTGDVLGDIENCLKNTENEEAQRKRRCLNQVFSLFAERKRGYGGLPDNLGGKEMEVREEVPVM